MNHQDKHSEDLKMIRKMMEDSSRFLSLSGLSGVFVGILAIIGALVARYIIMDNQGSTDFNILPSSASIGTRMLLLVDGAVVMLAAIATSSYLAIRQSRIKNKKVWSAVTRRLLINLIIPLISGALFIVILLINGDTEYLASAMLIFYGLALVNAGKFTFGEVQVLGTLEIITGLAAALFPQIGLIFWVIGFGILHILYGIILHRKYY